MSAVMTAPAPISVVERRCRIEEVFAGNFIDLLAMVPRNPVVRGLILAQTRKMPPDECITFDELKEWIELHCEKRLHRTSVAPAPAGGISIAVEFSETEYGRCSYSVPRSGSDEFQLDEDELLAMVQEAIDSDQRLESVVADIATKIRDDAWDHCDPSMDDYGEYEYDDYENNDSGNSDIDFSKSQIRERLTAFLRDRHPQLLEVLR